MSRSYRFPTVLLVVIATTGVSAASESPAPPPRDVPRDAPSRRVVNDRCPVMVEEPASPLQELRFKDAAVRFCCSKCEDRFIDDPTPYLSKLPQLSAASVQGGLEDARAKARVEHAARWGDRWTRPILLGLAAVLTGWLGVRAFRRGRQFGH